MIMEYKILGDNCILHIPTGMHIPKDRGNCHYQMFLQWCEEGNEPLPYEEPTIVDGIDDLPKAKELASRYTRDLAYTKLQPTDWVVVREMESGVPAPAEITAYRTAVRAAADDKVSTIEGKQKLETLTAYLGSDEFTAWPDAPSVSP